MMRTEPSPRARTLIAVAALACAACASEPTSGPGVPAAASRAPATPAAPSPAPEPAAPAPAPAEPATPQSRAQAQRVALEAVDQLQNGDEAGARATLERAMSMDPANELAKRLMDQIRADAQRELGPTFFRYTVQADDSLSKLAQRFLGDRFRFYILAKYNDIANPSRLQTGQVLKIPGREPPPVAAPARPPEIARPPEPTEAAKAPEEPKPNEAERLYKQALAQRQAGDLDAAYASLRDASRREPANATYSKQLEATRVDLVRRYDRAATQAFQRQNLDLAIRNWDRVLEIDPGNQKARLERARAEELKKRMQEKFGNK
jgi:tetratricopeptide (TPR) repeat protein